MTIRTRILLLLILTCGLLTFTSCEKEEGADTTLTVVSPDSETIVIPPKTRDYIQILSFDKWQALLGASATVHPQPISRSVRTAAAPTSDPLMLPKPDISFVIPRFQPLRLQGPTLADSFGWLIYEEPDWRWIDDTQKFDYVFSEVGTYRFKAHFTKGYRWVDVYFEVSVEEEKTPYLPYADRLVEFMPAPGQFRNVYPQFDLDDPNSWDTEEKRLAMVYKQILAVTSNTYYAVSLGSFGGYISYGFDHTIVDIPNDPDLFIPGNAFAGWVEPGIVEVAYDYNGNGKPDDDEWVVLKGEDYDSPANIKSYEVTYYKPKDIFAGDYIRWTDNKGGGGVMSPNSSHSQPYWPVWFTKESYTLKGTLLARKSTFMKGYVDATDSRDPWSETFRIEDADFTPPQVRLPGIDFVRVYSACMEDVPPFGEVSTEVGNVYDLNLWKM